jgi:hypothetical protein
MERFTELLQRHGPMFELRLKQRQQYVPARIGEKILAEQGRSHPPRVDIARQRKAMIAVVAVENRGVFGARVKAGEAPLQRDHEIDRLLAGEGAVRRDVRGHATLSGRVRCR